MAAVVAVDGVLIALAVNWATGGAMPAALAPYRAAVWPALAVFVLVAVAAAVAGVVLPGGAGDDAGRREEAAPLVRQVSNLRRHNPDFTGRASDLAGIRKSLSAGHSVALVARAWRQGGLGPDAQALYGMPGVGKTELAVEYAHRSGYDIVWWINAERGVQIDEQLRQLGDRLLLPTPGDGDWVSAVLTDLNRRLNWLLVFDNAGNAGDIRRYLPGSPRGHVIITSRNPEWGGVANAVGVDVFSEDDAREFLTAQLPHARRAEVDRLAEELGRLPLALAQAAGYLNQNPGLTVDGYLALYEKYEPLMLARGPAGSYPHTVDKTFQLSFAEVGRKSKAAQQLLCLYAFLAPDGIPERLVTAGAAKLPEPLRSAARDDLTRNDILTRLGGFSLIDRDGGSVRVHRLVQATVRGLLSERARRRWLAEARAAVGAAIDSGDTALVQALTPHFDAVKARGDA